jgi:hypothetical protein
VGDSISFSNEYQSDWQAKGREVGYVDEARNARIEELKAEMGEVATIPQGVRTQEQQRRLDALGAEWESLDPSSGRGTPDQPFKSTNDMLDFMLKRHADLALREGKDGFGWGMGADITESQDNFIRGNLDEVRVGRNGRGGYRVVGRKDGINVVTKNVTKDNLGNYIGKDNAKTVLAEFGGGRSLNELAQKQYFADYRDLSDKDKYMIYKLQQDRQGMHTFTGDDLQIGGHGNKVYYDQMAVNRANKLFKKYGMKVETQVVPVDEASRGKMNDILDMYTFEEAGMKEAVRAGYAKYFSKVKFTDEFRNQVAKKGQPLYAVPLAVGANKLMQNVNRLISPEYGQTAD